MTREDAIKIVIGTTNNTLPWRTNVVDALIALGILKLDEPRTVEDEAIRALYHLPLGDYSPMPHLNATGVENILNRLKECGLKIVKT